MTRADIERIWIDENRLYALTTAGQTASYALADWPRLANATQQQREAFTLSPFGIHWPELDEDLSFEGMCQKSTTSTIAV